MYCVNCGVKLSDTEKACPLCGVAAYHPDISKSYAEPLYPPYKYPEKRVSPKGALIIITTLFLIPLLITLLCDFQFNNRVTWSGYVIGGLLVGYVMLVLPWWFDKPNPAIFLPCAFVAIGLFLLYISLYTKGYWFLSFALPITIGVAMIVTAVTVLMRYFRKAALYIFGGARSLVFSLFGTPGAISPVVYSPVVQCIAAAIGCAGFCMLFNIHGRGMLLCILGGTLSWAVYLLVVFLFDSILTGYFFATIFAAGYAEAMARIRRFPAITYLLVSIFPLIPGAGIYYTTSYLADGNMAEFMAKGAQTSSIAGLMAIGIIMVSTIVRGTTVWRQMRKQKL